MKDIIKTIEDNTDFIVSWKAIKSNKTIFRVGNLNKEGCRVWEKDGKKQSKLYVKADNVQFLGGKGEKAENSAPAPAGADEDIPF